MSPHIYAVKQGEMDGSAYAVLRNRADYFAQSAATVNRLPAHPPVPREKALVPVSECATRKN